MKPCLDSNLLHHHEAHVKNLSGKIYKENKLKITQ